jgi:hypothetical protein
MINNLKKVIIVTLFIPVFLCGMKGHSFGDDVPKKVDIEIKKLESKLREENVVVLGLKNAEVTTKLNVIQTSSDVLEKERELEYALEKVSASKGKSKSEIKEAKNGVRNANRTLKRAKKKKVKAVNIALKKSKLLQSKMERQAMLAESLRELRSQTGLSDGVSKESPAPVIHINLDNIVQIKKDRVKKGISGRVENVKTVFINDTAVFVRPDNKFYIVMPLPLEDQFEFNFKAIGTNGKEVTDTITFVRQ